MKITMLGTGNALVTECYNTCFIISDDNKHLLVDGGGGNTVLSRIKSAGINWMDIRHIFVTHKHLDHIMGIIWMVRMICQHMRSGKYEGEAYIYSHREVLDLIKTMSESLIQKKDVEYLGKRLHLIEVVDGEEKEIIGKKMTFFDINSTKAKQFGFTMMLNDKDKLTCLGDEPFNECERKYALNSKWLLQEAFCLYSEKDEFKPYEKNHSTVKDACELAKELNAENVVLYHTEDKNIKNRKKLYTAEGREEYSGNIFVPDDMEVIEL